MSEYRSIHEYWASQSDMIDDPDEIYLEADMKDIERFSAAVEDPMWADHFECSKATGRAILELLKDRDPITNDIGLRSCPFCGKTEFIWTAPYAPSDSVPGYRVICDASGGERPKGCGSSTGWHETKQKAETAWNQRS